MMSNIADCRIIYIPLGKMQTHLHQNNARFTIQQTCFTLFYKDKTLPKFLQVAFPMNTFKL
jgi:hypothetical protein